MNVFTIKDLENLSGIKAHTIRIWEQRYNFLKPSRTGTNIRYYNNQELKTVLNVSLLNKHGYKISQIDKMTEQEVRSKIITLSDGDAQEERIIHELIVHMVDLNTDSFEELLDGFIFSRGIERAMNHIVFPFLQRIGVLWVTGHIHPAQEHLVTNIIRQKLIAGIEWTASHAKARTTVLLFLPEGELHELGLLYVYYLMRSNGVKVLYLGADVPLSDVEFVARYKNPDYLYTHITGIASPSSLEKYLSQVCQRIPQIPLVVSGQLVRTQLRKIPPTVDFRRSIPEVLAFITTIK